MTRRAGPHAFTLLEMLLAVGAMVLLAVALAAAFAGIGRTVATGQRVSALHQAAAAIERQMRADFESMTRDGVLLIRNEYAETDGTPFTRISLYPGDREARPRRRDEIVFFAGGRDFVTAREPLHPAFIARSDTARIYYGHGNRVPPNLSSGSTYRQPDLDDENDLTKLSGSGNPNQYASDWLLLRHVTLLRQPATTTPVDPGQLGTWGLTSAQLADRDTQVALQPAASHLFRALALLYPGAPSFGGQPIRGGAHPASTSGLVDIATTDLAEVRAIVMGTQTSAGAPIQPGDVSSATWFESNADLSWFPRVALGSNDAVLAGIHAWMHELLPAYSHAPTKDQRIRVRAEPGPTDFYGALKLSGAALSYRRADQGMLSASVFIPRCTEFIVEWSFGEVYPDTYAVTSLRNQLVWHGLKRTTDPTAVTAGSVGFGKSSTLLTQPYDPATDIAVEHSLPYRLLNPPAGGSEFGGFRVKRELIHGLNLASDVASGHLTSFFGYVDPTFNPLDPDPAVGNDTSDQPTIPWGWPKLVRVTLSLADAIDPSVEQSFQFVFTVPGNPEP